MSERRERRRKGKRNDERVPAGGTDDENAADANPADNAPYANEEPYASDVHETAAKLPRNDVMAGEASEQKSCSDGKQETEKKVVTLGAEEYEELKRQADLHKKLADDYLNKLKYLQAEFENYKKWSEKDKAEFVKIANERLIISLLPVLDTFEQALAASKDDKSPFRNGVQMIYNELMAALKSSGLEPMNTVGQMFDPYQHEAMLVEPRTDVKEDTILEELQKGYKLNSRVVRTAKVKISKLPSSPADRDNLADSDAKPVEESNK